MNDESRAPSPQYLSVPDELPQEIDYSENSELDFADVDPICWLTDSANVSFVIEFFSAADCSPSLDAAVRVLSNLCLGGDVEERSCLWRYSPPRPDSLRPYERTEEDVQRLVEQLRREEDMRFALAWHVEGSATVHLDHVGYESSSDAFASLAQFLAEDALNWFPECWPRP